MRFSLAAILVLLALIAPPPLAAATVEYDLVIAEQEVNLTGRPTAGMTINGAIPGPLLRFTEGDLARIRVHNAMETETSIHWHGLLVPPGMDGVPYVSFPPIQPGATFTYEFPLRQSGTYWYHSHSGLQEQRGVYGAMVIAPRGSIAPEIPEQVILFSDWTDEDPHAVLRTLKRGSDWYAVAKGSGQSLLGAARLGRLGDFLKRELQRMPPMDIADVAYDRFLANGQQEIVLPAAPDQ
ncbi:MAG: multicopper oxidase domain-containing protein, partial [Actinobacteria bacterium]|nr:multicopper oxidase domain-containing protein [Actinomycetota bacterium]